MSRAQLQSAYPKLTELFSNSRSDDNGKLKPTLERLLSSFSFPFSSSEEAKECAKSGGGRFLLTADGALLASSVCFGACALVLSVSILTSRPLLVRKSVVNSKTSRFGGLPESGERRFCVWSRVNVGIRGFVHLWNGVFDDCIVRDGKFTRGVVGVRVFVRANAGFCFLCGNIAVRDNRRSRGENKFGHFRDSDDDVDVNQSFISENFRRKW